MQMDMDDADLGMIPAASPGKPGAGQASFEPCTLERTVADFVKLIFDKDSEW
jgi:hypothetical protein|eukprot:COSAG01_NODE_9580_length_2402_cov_39.155884_3_plen_52_part_00